MGSKHIAALSAAAALALSVALVTPAFASEQSDVTTGPASSSSVAEDQGVQVPDLGGASVLACNITALTPYANNNLVWTGGNWSGCTAPVKVSLLWDHFGPNTIMGVQPSATSGIVYGWHCNWGTPQDRSLYGEVVDYNGALDDSTTAGFTSSTDSCR